MNFGILGSLGRGFGRLGGRGGGGGGGGGSTPVEILWNDDFDSDNDGVLELATLLNMQHRGHINIGMILITSAHDEAAAGVYSVLKYYEDNDASGYAYTSIPIAQDTDDGGNITGAEWLEAVVAAYGVAGHLVAADFPNPVEVTRQYFVDLIAAGKKCIWIATATANSIEKVMDSAADGISPLTGLQLIEQAVSELWWIHAPWPTIGGNSSDQTSSSVEFDYVLDNWPATVPIMLSQLTAAQAGTAGADSIFFRWGETNPLRTGMATEIAAPSGKVGQSTNHIIAAGIGPTDFDAAVWGTGAINSATGAITSWTDSATPSIAGSGPHYYLGDSLSATEYRNIQDQWLRTSDPVSWPAPWIGSPSINARAQYVLDQLTYTAYADYQKAVHDFWEAVEGDGDEANLSYLLVMAAGNTADKIIPWVEGQATPVIIGTDTGRPFSGYSTGGAAVASNYMQLGFDPASDPLSKFALNSGAVVWGINNNPTNVNTSDWGNNEFQSDAKSGSGNWFARFQDTTGHSYVRSQGLIGLNMLRRSSSGNVRRNLDTVEVENYSMTGLGSITSGAPWYLAARNIGGTPTSTNPSTRVYSAFAIGSGSLSYNFPVRLRTLLRNLGAWDVDD